MHRTKREIRAAFPAEADALSALAKRSKAHWGYSRAFMQACERELTYEPQDITDHPFCVLQTAGRIVGFYALRRIDATKVELDALFVIYRVDAVSSM